MRDLTPEEDAALAILVAALGEAALLHTGGVGANLQHSNMDSIVPLTWFLQSHGIHDYGAQGIGPQHKVVAECVVFDGRTTELSPFSFNRAVSRGRNRFWIPALRRMAGADDMLAFAEDSGLPIVVNLTAVTKSDPAFTELSALLSGSSGSAAAMALATAESSEGVPTQMGFATSGPEVDEMERYSRQLATQYFESQGWSVRPTSGSIPYDLVATRSEERLYIEVKSSRGPAEAVFLTYGEVDHAREAPASALFIVSDLTVATVNHVATVSGGRRRVIHPWVPQDSDLSPLTYRYRVPHATWLD